MRWSLLALLLVPAAAVEGGCAACLERPLEVWCFHDAEAGGPRLPDGDATCSPPLLRDSRGAITEIAVQCGRFHAWSIGGDDGGLTHYFHGRSERHVATEYAGGCSGGGTSYGRRIDCEATCGYDPDGDLPLCE